MQFPFAEKRTTDLPTNEWTLSSAGDYGVCLCVVGVCVRGGGSQT